MWKNKWLGKLLLTVGAFPVHRESADREALQRAEEVFAAASSSSCSRKARAATAGRSRT